MAPRLRLPTRRRGDRGSSERPRRGGDAPASPSVNGGESNGSRPPDPPSHPPVATEPNPRPKLKKLRLALVFVGLSVLALISWIFGIMMAVAGDLPQLEDRAQFAHAQNSIVYDIHGEKIATLTNNEGRILISSGDIAPVMKEATVAIEDQRFYEHGGVDFQGIGRAVVQDVLHTGASQGASTITEQFVKNALRAQQSRTVFQKLREAALAYQLERHWDKDKIITQYLNEIYFGEGAYGIEEAAKTYFGWNHEGCGQGGGPACASDLLPWEAALLAGIISNPSAYDPRTNPEDALARRNVVLQNMADQGYITQDEYPKYSQQPIPKQSQIEIPTEDSKAPYFTSWMRQQLVDKYGAGEAFGGGLDVQSTLDLGLQNEVQRIAYERTGGVGLDTAVVVLDNATGGVRAMVGGNDYRNEPFNLATQGHRQPGSAFKPFTLVTALEQGHSPDQVFTSAPQELPYRAQVRNNRGEQKVVDELFEVHNYGDEYAGSASLATATAHSDNSVYSQLGMSLSGGPAAIAATANRMGIGTNLSTSETKYSVGGGPFEPYNPALILGGLETGVTPLEMAHAYQTLQHGGQIVSGTMASSPNGPVAINKVGDEPPGSGGDLVEPNDGGPGYDKVETKQVVPPEIAATARTMLHAVVTEGTGTNANTGDPAEWGKTGTTENNGDAWFVGANDDVTVAIWVGHATSLKPMETEYGGGPVDGGTIPALIFNEVIGAYEQQKAAEGRRNPSTTTTTTSPVTTTPAAPAPSAPSPTPPAAAPESPPATPPQSQSAPPASQSTPPSSAGGGSAGGAPATGGVSG